MMMNKKGDISIGMIITAAIALIVLVVVIAIFAGYFTGWQQSIGNESQYVSECEQLSGSNIDNAKWVEGTSCPDGSSKYSLVSDSAKHPGEVCCVTYK